MVALTESQHKGEFLVSEGPGSISREVGILTSGEVIVDGNVLAIVANKLVKAEGSYNSDTQVSDETIAGIAYGDYDATGADLKGCVYIARLAEVKDALVHTVPSEYSSDSESDVGAIVEDVLKDALAAKFIVFR